MALTFRKLSEEEVTQAASGIRGPSFDMTPYVDAINEVRDTNSGLAIQVPENETPKQLKVRMQKASKSVGAGKLKWRRDVKLSDGAIEISFVFAPPVDPDAPKSKRGRRPRKDRADAETAPELQPV